MKKIEEDIELLETDGVHFVTVYLGSFDRLVKAKLKWRKADEETCEALGADAKVIKLSEIVEQLDGLMCTLFMEGPIHGEIWQYGNYGDEWYKIGETYGYA